jgi:membrane fusion protein, multidrug efflux system
VSQEKAYVYATLDETTVLQFHRAGREGRLGSQGDAIPVEMQLSDEVGFPRRGQVESVDNRLDAATGSLIVRMVFDNSDGSLVPGLFARVRVPLAAPSPTLLISERAVGTDQNQKYVLALAPDQTVTYRAVKLGPTLHGKRVVREGLRSGEKIVVNGLQRVRPGMAVTAELAAESDAGVVNVATR